MRKIAGRDFPEPPLASPSFASGAIEMTEPDEILITRTLGGEIVAFERLVERHRDVVFRVASRIVGRDDAEDVSQDAFLRAFARLEKFRGESTFRTWLLQITQRVAFRWVTRSRRVGVAPDDALEERPDRDATRQPAAELERRERRQRLERKLALLRSQYRALIVLRDLEGLSYAEIATILDMPVGSVKGRLHRARGELIELLRHNTYDWELPV